MVPGLPQLPDDVCPGPLGRQKIYRIRIEQDHVQYSVSLKRIESDRDSRWLISNLGLQLAQSSIKRQLELSGPASPYSRFSAAAPSPH